MIQGGDGARFLLETPQTIAIASERFRQDLDRYVTVEPGIASTIHFAHTAGAKRRENFVRANLLPGAETHWFAQL